MKTLKLELSPQEMQFVWNCLMEAPGKLSYGIAKKFEAQMAEQNAPELPGKNEESSKSE